mmetsp:Transcript_30007/g.64832  ORF Transcript_30007/g.64832 Transcript_30007/m.64832 type:complete len:125 (+) Transcript_30007:118-492(+)
MEGRGWAREEKGKEGKIIKGIKEDGKEGYQTRRRDRERAERTEQRKERATERRGEGKRRRAKKKKHRKKEGRRAGNIEKKNKSQRLLKSRFRRAISCGVKANSELRQLTAKIGVVSVSGSMTKT